MSHTVAHPTLLSHFVYNSHTLNLDPKFNPNQSPQQPGHSRRQIEPDKATFTPALSKSQKKNKSRKRNRQIDDAQAKSIGAISFKQEHHLHRREKYLIRKGCRHLQAGINRAKGAKATEEAIDNLSPKPSSSAIIKEAKNNIPARQQSRNLLDRAAAVGAIAYRYRRTRENLLDTYDRAEPGKPFDGLQIIHKKLFQ